jgi:hypothetical protein
MSVDIRYRLVSVKGEVIFSNLNDDEIGLIPRMKDKSSVFIVNNVKYRAACANTPEGNVFLSSCDQDYLRSSRRFNASLDVVKNIVGYISVFYSGSRNRINEDTKRLLHNLISLNAHIIQEIYSLVPQDDLANKQSGHLAMVENIIKSNTKDVAIAVLRILKSSASMKTEFSVFNKLFNDNPNLRRSSHEVHKVLMNVFYLFFSDFTDKGVLVDVRPSKLKATFDYELVHVALYYIIENTAKYILPNTKLIVTCEDAVATVLISFRMKSIQVKENEVDAIFEDGYSGEVPRKTGQSGKGIGMNRVAKIIDLNAGKIVFFPDFSSVESIRGVPYQDNIIMLYLPKK